MYNTLTCYGFVGSKGVIILGLYRDTEKDCGSCYSIITIGYILR